VVRSVAVSAAGCFLTEALPWEQHGTSTNDAVKAGFANGVNAMFAADGATTANLVAGAVQTIIRFRISNKAG
jgi:hypothetical protein